MEGGLDTQLLDFVVRFKINFDAHEIQNVIPNDEIIFASRRIKHVYCDSFDTLKNDVLCRLSKNIDNLKH